MSQRPFHQCVRIRLTREYFWNNLVWDGRPLSEPSRFAPLSGIRSSDSADYRDVGGIEMPFRLTFAWLDGPDSIELKEVQTEVPN